MIDAGCMSARQRMEGMEHKMIRVPGEKMESTAENSIDR